jgi:hypothetical protein
LKQRHQSAALAALTTRNPVPLTTTQYLTGHKTMQNNAAHLAPVKGRLFEQRLRCPPLPLCLLLLIFPPFLSSSSLQPLHVLFHCTQRLTAASSSRRATAATAATSLLRQPGSDGRCRGGCAGCCCLQAGCCGCCCWRAGSSSSSSRWWWGC